MIVLRSENPKARKDHKCNYCLGVIPKGEVYEKQTNIFDGNLYTWKAHRNCQAVASELNMFDECDEGLTDDDFHEFISIKYHDLISDEIDDDDDNSFEIPDFYGILKYVIDNVLKEGGK